MTTRSCIENLPATMVAATYRCTGAATEVLSVEEMPRPTPQAGELLVRVVYSAVHPADVKRRAGVLGSMDWPLVIPHSDGVGEVVAVGDTLHAAAWLGQRVWLRLAQRGRAAGTAAEFVALPVELCRPIPANVAWEHCAALGITAITAHAALFAGGPVAAKTVLVHGASGAVGRMALAWARWGGAQRIWGVCRTPEACEMALASGATDVAVTPTAQTCPPFGCAIDRLVDVDVGASSAWAGGCLAPGAWWSAYATSGPVTLDFRSLTNCNATLRFVQSHSLAPSEVAHALEDIDGLLASPWLPRVPPEIYELTAIAQAHERVETHGSRTPVLVAPRKKEVLNGH
jgi:NADPH2:quinone reductase